MPYAGYVSAQTVAAQIGSSETNKPIRFPLSLIPAAQWALIRADGGNLYVTNNAGTRLPAYVDWIDTGLQDGDIWFEADTLSSVSNTTYRIHIDDFSVTAPAVGSTYGRNNVWGGTVDVRAGFQESAGNFIDSTGNGNDGVPTITAYGGATRLGQAQDIIRNTDYVDFPSTLNATGANFVSIWANINTSLSGQLQTIFDNQGLSSANDQFNLIYDRRSPGGLPDDRIRGNYDNRFVDFSPFAGTLGTGWHHFVMQWTGSQVQLYIDGVLRGSSGIAPVLNPNALPLRVGQQAGGSTFGLDGEVDELWFKNLATVSPGFVTTMYNNQAGTGHSFWAAVTWNPSSATPVFPDNVSWGFTLNGSVIEAESVQGWDALTSQYSFDGLYVRSPNQGELTFCGGTAYDAIFALDPCKNHILELWHICNTEPTLFATYHVPQSGIRFDCEKCTATLTLSDGNLLAVMEAEGGTETCWAPNRAIEIVTGEPSSTATTRNGPFQVVSGGNVGRSIPNRSVLNLLNLMLDREVPGAIVTGSLLNTPYQPEVQTITIPGVYDNTGGGAILRITSMFGSVYEVSCEAGTPIPADAYAKALMWVDAGTRASIDMSVDEIVSRIQRAESDGINTITITADYSFSVELIDAVGVTVASGVILQDFEYGLEGLSITPKGLDDPNICISWNDLTEALACLASPVIVDGPTEIAIEDSTNYFSIGGAVTSTDIGERRREFETKWLKSQLSIQQAFEIDDFERSQEDWIWNGTTQPIRITGNVAPVGTWTYGGVNPTMFTITGGTLAVDIVPPTGIANIVTVILTVNGVDTTWQIVVNVPSSGSQLILDIAQFPQFSILPPLCLNPGDVIGVRVDVSGLPLPVGTSIGVVFDAVISYDIPCFDNPNFNQDDADDEQFVLTETACCGGQANCILANNIDAGLGYALSEQLTGLFDYKDTHFLIMADPDDPTDPIAFPRTFFFASSDAQVSADCPCYVDSEQVFFYYNVLLQRLHIMHRKRGIIPSGYTWDAFYFSSYIEISGAIRGGLAAAASDPVQRVSTDVVARNGYYGWDKLTFKKCLTSDQFLAYKAGGLLNITDDCLCSGTGTIVAMSYTPRLTGSVDAEISVLMKCTEMDTSCTEEETGLERVVTIDDDNLFFVEVGVVGSNDAGVDISTDPSADYCDVICLVDKNRDFEIIREVELLTICYHYDAGAGGTIIDSITVNPLILPADSAAIQALFTPNAVACGYTYDKVALDVRLKGYDFFANGNYGYTENALGFNYYVLYFGWPFLLDTDGTPIDDGAFHRIKGTVSVGPDSSPQAENEVRRAIKQFKNNSIAVFPTTTGGHPGTEFRYEYIHTSWDAQNSYPPPPGLNPPTLAGTNWWNMVSPQSFIDDGDGTGINQIVSVAPVVKAGYSAGTSYQVEFRTTTLNGMRSVYKAAYYATGAAVTQSEMIYAYLSGSTPFGFQPINAALSFNIISTSGVPATVTSWSISVEEEYSGNILAQGVGSGTGTPVLISNIVTSQSSVLEKWIVRINATTSDGLEVSQECRLYIAETV